jgi:ubiquinone/menaquinone biosynthesis C-methylase UbiE
MSRSEPVSIQIPSAPQPAFDAETAVRERYQQAAQTFEPSLCCAVEYDSRLLEAIPAEVIERDYGCGNPARYLHPGETVLDLGSGGGKICFIAAQIVGPQGRIIGVDMNDSMLDLARRSAPTVAEKLGFANVQFYKGKIQDLALNRELLDQYLADNPVRSEVDLLKLEAHIRQLRAAAPLIADRSIDVVVSNCVLNLVSPEDKLQLFREIFRVLRPGGRAVISDIVSDQVVPAHLQADPDLWSGCISGAFEESDFLQRFGDVGFQYLEIADLTVDPWREIDGIQFRSMTVIAHKPLLTATDQHDEPADESIHAIYRGPFAAAMDDNGQEYGRGMRVPLSADLATQLAESPIGKHFVFVAAQGDAETHGSLKSETHGGSHCGPGCC